MQFSPRQLAQSSGAKTYFTGKPCIHGHVVYRYTASGACSRCTNPEPGDKPKIPKIMVEPWSNDPTDLIRDKNGGYWLHIK